MSCFVDVSARDPVVVVACRLPEVCKLSGNAQRYLVSVEGIGVVGRLAFVIRSRILLFVVDDGVSSVKGVSKNGGIVRFVQCALQRLYKHVRLLI
jgi:hypothetical protein